MTEPVLKAVPNELAQQAQQALAEIQAASADEILGSIKFHAAV